jgi:predicted amidohydrolase YtcJ
MPHQKVAGSLHEVLPYMTSHVARMTGDQASLGTFVSGHLASFVVLEKLPQTKDDYDSPLVLETWIGGRKAYERKAVKAA